MAQRVLLVTPAVREGNAQDRRSKQPLGIDADQPWILRFVPRLDRVEPQLTEPTRIYDDVIEMPRGPIDAAEGDRSDGEADQP